MEKEDLPFLDKSYVKKFHPEKLKKYATKLKGI